MHLRRLDDADCDVRRTPERRARPDLHNTGFAGIVVGKVVGAGRRCSAFAARAGGRELVLKVYHPRAVAVHASRRGGSLARYEYERNAAVRAVPGLAEYVAEPLGYWSSPRSEMFLQERVRGESLANYLPRCCRSHRDRLLGQLGTILERAHRAGLFDLDLHAGNVLVGREGDGSVRPLLFDFNKVPYHLQPPNQICRWLVDLGLIAPHARDRRLWRRIAKLSAG